MKMTYEVKKKLLEELMEMMDDMSSGTLPKKKGGMMISMEAGDDSEPDPTDQGEPGEGEDDEDMQGMDPRLMELIKKKKAEKMSGMRMAH